MAGHLLWGWPACHFHGEGLEIVGSPESDPAALVVIVVVLGWRWPWLGRLVFLALGVVYVVSNRPHPWLWDLAIAGPLAVTGALFVAN